MSDYFDTGFCVHRPSWHGKERLLTEAERPRTWKEARPPAGLDWDPIPEPVYALAGVDEHGNPRYEAIEGWYRACHSGTGDTLTVNMNSTHLITNEDLGEIIEAVLAQTNVRFETAGAAEKNRAIWCLAVLDEPIQVPGDNSPVLPYLAVTNRHDGKGGCTLRATAVRIVCANTFRAAELEGERTGATFSFRHSRRWRDRLEEARRAITGVRSEMAAYAEMAEALLGVPVTTRQRELFVREFIPTPSDGIISDRVARNIEDARKAMREILASRTTEPVAGTVYGLVQAAGEYLDHVRRAHTWETRVSRTILRPEPLKAKALKLAIAASNN